MKHDTTVITVAIIDFVRRRLTQYACIVERLHGWIEECEVIFLFSTRAIVSES